MFIPWYGSGVLKQFTKYDFNCLGYFWDICILWVKTLISGIGNSLIVVSGVLAIGRSFTGTLKTVAFSMQSLGTPIAGFFYPHLLTFLLDTYRLKGTLLILGGLLLNALPCAIVFWHVVDVNHPIIMLSFTDGFFIFLPRYFQSSLLHISCMWEKGKQILDIHWMQKDSGRFSWSSNSIIVSISLVLYY